MTTIEGAGFTGKPAIETAIRIALTALMAAVTVRIIHPFLMPVAWVDEEPSAESSDNSSKETNQ